MKLFQTTVPNEQLDPSFVHIRDSEDCADDRAYLEDLWKEFSSASDSDFHTQLQTRGNFHGRVWEMRLPIVLKRIGLPVDLSKRRGGPDVLVSCEPRVWIEAVAPRTTADLEANADQARRFAAPSPEDEVILRYTQSLAEKWQVLQSYKHSGIVKPNDAFVVAISGSNLDHPCSGPGPHWVAKPLYGFGGLVTIFEVGMGKPSRTGWTRQLERDSQHGSPVEADLFLSDKRAAISAVLFSAHHVKNRPEVHGRIEGSDFRLFHNPFASVPLPKGLIRRGEEWVFEQGRLRRLNNFVQTIAA